MHDFITSLSLNERKYDDKGVESSDDATSDITFDRKCFNDMHEKDVLLNDEYEMDRDFGSKNDFEESFNDDEEFEVNEELKQCLIDDGANFGNDFFSMKAAETLNRDYNELVSFNIKEIVTFDCFLPITYSSLLSNLLLFFSSYFKGYFNTAFDG